MRNQQILHLRHRSTLTSSAFRATKPKKSQIIDWLTDKDKRATIVWTSAGYGSLLIAGYYLWLGFTPAFNFGQASLLLFQAFIVGGILTLYFSMLVFFPTWAYSALGIETDGFVGEQRKRAITALVIRSLLAQVLFTTTAFVLFNLWPSEQSGNFPLYWAGAAELSIFSGLILAFIPRLNEFGKTESIWSYLWSLLVLGFLGFVGSVMLYESYSLTPKDLRPGEFHLMMAWFFVTGISAVIGTTGKKAWFLKILIPFAMFAYLLSSFNNILFPFKGTAAAIGIAEPRPVTLIFPSTVCPQIKKALDDMSVMSCEGERAGVLDDVKLLNTLGERWVIRLGSSTENIVFDGKGTLVRRRNTKTDKQ